MSPPSEESKNCPPASPFKQQKLPAWKPILTPGCSITVLFVVGSVFIIFGAVILTASLEVKEITLDYTDCVQSLPTDVGVKCADLLLDESKDYIKKANITRCTCAISFDIEKEFGDRDVYMYYELSNFFQDHRRFATSVSSEQLRDTKRTPIKECKPFDNSPSGRPYTPCGAVANALFNDTIQLESCSDSSCTTTMKIGQSGFHITWPSDRDKKFVNPSANGGDLCDAPPFVDGVRPNSWWVEVCNLGHNTSGIYNPWSQSLGSSGRGYENEDLITWMRIAYGPNFRKMYRKLLQNIPDGPYRFLIDYNYPVTHFSGKKAVVLTTTSWMGGANPFLGGAYLVVGILSVVIGAVLAIMATCTGHRKLGDLDLLKWK
eukprot:m.213319 g.213319  ORF g.213319 m.213319 type:complete len:375 (+) comp54026_c0_seq3:134-1258(+)